MEQHNHNVRSGYVKHTPIQIAILVDKYLGDNNFSETRTTFRKEVASSSSSSVLIQEVPLNLLGLDKIVEQNVYLKHKIEMMNQERNSMIRKILTMNQERNSKIQKINTLKRHLYDVCMSCTSYQESLTASNAKSVVVPQAIQSRTPQDGSTVQSVSNTHNGNFLLPVMNVSNTLSAPQSNTHNGNFSLPMMNVSDKKRKDTVTKDVVSVAKKRRGRPPKKKPLVQGQSILPQANINTNNQIVSPPTIETQPSTSNLVPSGTQLQRSSVSCILPPVSIQASSIKRVMVSRSEQLAYIDGNQCISPGKTDADKSSMSDHVRSGLDSITPKSMDKSLSNSDMCESLGIPLPKESSDMCESLDIPLPKESSDMCESLDIPSAKEFSDMCKSLGIPLPNESSMPEFPEVTDPSFFDDLCTNDGLGSEFSLLGIDSAYQPTSSHGKGNDSGC